MLLLFVFTLLFGQILSEQIFVCENNTAIITCPPLTHIHVDSANFGRTSTTHCPKDRYDQNVNCISNNSTDAMRSICEGQQSCNISASNLVFSDPCPGVYKYLEANYTCENNPTTITSTSTPAPTTKSTTTSTQSSTSVSTTGSSFKPDDDDDDDDDDNDHDNDDDDDNDHPIDGVHQHVTCYDNHFEISCPSKSAIQILSANFGRTSSSICPMAGYDSNTHCGLDEKKRVKKWCNGYQICGFSVDAHRFRKDPCYLTYKYLTVTYQCVLKKKPKKKIEKNEQITCSGDSMHINCPKETRLNILSADFGRHSPSLCPNAGHDQNTKCSENVTPVVKKRCNKKNECEIHAEQDEFSKKDKCYGTYKYLTVNYVCELH